MNTSHKTIGALLVAILGVLTATTIASAQQTPTPVIETVALVDAASGHILTGYEELQDGHLIDTALTGTGLTLEAVSSGDTQSVMFQIDGQDARLENNPPYRLTIAGESSPHLTNTVAVTITGYSGHHGKGAATEPTTINLNFGYSNGFDLIRISATPDRELNYPLEGAIVTFNTDQQDNPHAMAWLELDSEHRYATVVWFLDNPDTDTDSVNYDTQRPVYPIDLNAAEPGPHSVTALATFAGGETITTTAWFTYDAGSGIAIDDVPAPITPDLPSLPDPPRVSLPTLPPISLPPITLPPLPPTTEPGLIGIEDPDPPGIFITPEILFDDINTAELVSVDDYPRTAHLIIETDNGSEHHKLGPACVGLVLEQFGLAAFQHNPDFQEPEIEHDYLTGQCPNLTQVIDQHVEFPRLLTTTRGDQGPRYWLIDTATSRTVTEPESHKHVIAPTCADELQETHEAIFVDAKPKTVSELPTIYNIDCADVIDRVNSIRTIPKANNEDPPEEEPSPTPTTTSTTTTSIAPPTTTSTTTSTTTTLPTTTTTTTTPPEPTTSTSTSTTTTSTTTTSTIAPPAQEPGQ